MNIINKIIEKQKKTGLNNKLMFIFDFDGTILDSKKIVYSLNKKLINENFNIKLNEKEFIEMFDENYYTSLSKLIIKKKGIIKAIRFKIIKSKNVKKYIKEILFDLLKHKNCFKIFKNINKIIKTIKKNKKSYLCLVSSGFEKFIIDILKKNRINLFDDIICSEKSVSKTKNINFLKKKYNIKRKNIFYIGDTTGDAIEASKANINCIIVSYGFQSKKHILKQIKNNNLLKYKFSKKEITIVENIVELNSLIKNIISNKQINYIK